MAGAGGRFAAILFDFDGVLIESEVASSRQLATLLTEAGHPTTPAQAQEAFMGLAGPDFVRALERRIGGPVPDGLHARRTAEGEQAMVDGIAAVAGAVAFVAGLSPALPIAVVSSSSSRWIEAHLRHLGLAERFAGRLVSGAEHVARGKPAPDIYLYAAAMLGLPITRCLVIEDSAVGVTGAVASGATVMGLCAGSHCDAAHGAALRARGAHGIATSFAEVATFLAAAPDQTDPRGAQSSLARR